MVSGSMLAESHPLDALFRPRKIIRPGIEPITAGADLAVIATGADRYLPECAAGGVKAAVVTDGRVEPAILDSALQSGMRILGPDCLGFAIPSLNLNTTAADAPLPGHIAFLSESSAIAATVIDWGRKELVGFSAVVTTGAMADVGWGDLIDYFGEDPSTRAILLYCETVGDSRRLLSAAREVALTKPIIVLRPGGGRAAVFDAAMRRCGVLRVHSLADLFYMAEILDKQPRPKGPRLAIVSNGRGPGMLAADSLRAAGGSVARLEDATPDSFAGVIESVQADERVDGLLAIITPRPGADPAALALTLASSVKGWRKPVLASWMGGGKADAGVDVLNRAGIPTYAYPDTAGRLFSYLWSYTETLRGLYETPSVTEGADSPPPTSLELSSLLTAYRIHQDLPLAAFPDPDFGPVLRFGRALALPPLNTTLARRALELAGESASDRAVESFVRFAGMIASIPAIEFLDVQAGSLRLASSRPPLAIRPYPSQYAAEWTARDGTPLRFRPIRPEDEPAMVRFHESVSDRSVYLRYFQFMKLSQRVAHERLTRICFNDYDREIALVAEHEDRILGVGRLRKLGTGEAEIALLIIDAAQGKGLGSEMVRRLIEVARAEAVSTVIADVHGENAKMIHLLRRFGFQLRQEPGDTALTGRLALS
jgi:succinyl-CoA synthetase alpha subunit/RimJ/RimL family protein N-acetyltransferase